MSPENLSRRAILAGAASVPALALPAVVASAAATVSPAIADEKAATVARAGQIVDVLRSRYVCAGWTLDEARAAEFVRSVHLLDYAEEDSAEFAFILDWMFEHEQSLDWLLKGDVRGMICTGARCSPRVDAELIALGERLKAVCAEDERLNPRKQYEAYCEAVPFENRKSKLTEKQQAVADSYHAAYQKWNAVAHIEGELAKAICKVPANTRIGDGVRAFTALMDNRVLAASLTEEAALVLWEMAARAGFRPPAHMAKRLKRRGVSVAQIAREAVRS
jgi:hypothetical protein